MAPRRQLLGERRPPQQETVAAIVKSGLVRSQPGPPQTRC